MTLYEEHCRSERKTLKNETLVTVCIGGHSDGKRLHVQDSLHYLALPIFENGDFSGPTLIEYYTPRRFIIGSQYVIFYALTSITDLEAFIMLLDGYKQGEHK